MKRAWRGVAMRWKKSKKVSAFNPLAMERVCHWKMPLRCQTGCRFDCAAGRKSDPSPTVLRALDIVKRDYEKKLTRVMRRKSEK